MKRAFPYGVLIAALVAALNVVSAGQASAGEEVDPAAVELSREYGIEPQEAQARIDRQDEIGALSQDLVRAFPSSFGGMWIDHAQGGAAIAGFTRSVPAAELEKLADRHGLTGHVRGAVVPYPILQLERTVDELTTGLAEANRGAQRTLSLGIRPDLSRVELTIPAEVALTAVQQRFVDDAQARYRDALAVVRSEEQATPAACVFPFCDDHLRGGLGINNGGGCTSGFIAHAGGVARWILTAGHCVDNGGTWTTRSPTTNATRTIGPSWNFSYGLTGDIAGIGGDMGIILITSASETSGPHVYSANQTRYNITWAWNFGFPPLGSVVCKTGRTSGFQCGKVNEVKKVLSYTDGTLLVNLTGASMLTCKGDSGGPIYANHVAFGITSGLGAKFTSNCGLKLYYQDIARAQSAMGVQVLLA